MKVIAKTLVFAAILFAFAACEGKPEVPETPETPETPEQPETPETPETPQGLAVTATLAPLMDFTGTWTTGDEIFGFTSEGTTVSFGVKSVDAATKTATLEQKTEVEIAEGTKIHAIFCPGKTASDLTGQTLALDFTEQSADVVPVLYLATATAAKDALAFAFESAVSVIGITDPVFPKATTADKLVRFAVSGHEIVSSGVVSVQDGSLVFTGNAPDKFITKTVNATPVVNGEAFTIEDPVYIVVPASPIASVSAIDKKNNFFVYPVEEVAEGPAYIGINGKTFPVVALPASTGVTAGGVVWAKANLGGTGVTDMGDIYRWSDTGKIYSERTGTTSVEFDAAHAEGFNSYEGECYLSGGVYTKYNKTDNKTVLDPVDDIVCLTYPGTGWRMPTTAEFNALLAEPNVVTYNSGSANNVGTTVTQGENTVFFRGTTQVCAPSSKDKTTIGKRGRFWTSTMDAANYNDIGGNPDYVQFNGSDGRKAEAPAFATAYRHSGYSIRPVKTVE